MIEQNEFGSADDSGRQRRRRIVKGIAGLPAIMTLASGSALANSSSLQCLATADGKYRPTPGGRDECLPPNAVDVIPGTGDQLAVAPGDDALRTLDNGNYCLLYVDENGNIIETGGSEEDLVTHSCYTSFVTHAIDRFT
jgi:hypothetical protein